MKMMKLISAMAVVGVLASAGMVATTAQAQPGGSESKQSGSKSTGATKASSLKVGDAAPAFTLTDTDGKTHNLSDFKGKVVVIEWFNPECPFIVKHHAESKKNMTFNKLYEEYNSKGVVFLAINSSAPGKQGAGLELNKKMKTEYKMEYPILLDESGDTGREYGAKTTPHCFVIDAAGHLAYQGAIDNNSNIDKGGDKNYVKAALDEVLAGKSVSESQTKSYGCSVKYAK